MTCLLCWKPVWCQWNRLKMNLKELPFFFLFSLKKSHSNYLPGLFSHGQLKDSESTTGWNMKFKLRRHHCICHQLNLAGFGFGIKALFCLHFANAFCGIRRVRIGFPDICNIFFFKTGKLATWKALPHRMTVFPHDRRLLNKRRLIDANASCFKVFSSAA